MSQTASESLLKRGVSEIIVEQELVDLLQTGKSLRLKQGFDPSAPDIHLGHVVGLRKLRQFQELGHQVVLIVGDWTAQIGDPSGQSATRRMLSAKEVMANARTYMAQFFQVVDKAKTEVRWQSEWFANFDLADVVRLTSKFTVAQFLAREDFNKRFREGRPIAVTELLYPLMQAYDSVAIEADVEFGGIDQKFNCLVGRELQEMMGQRRQQIFLVPLLVGTDGSQKMSKSLGNYIGINEPAEIMFGKVMSIPDTLIFTYFELLTDVPSKELADMRTAMVSDRVNPMDLKKHLAREIVSQFQGPGPANLAEEEFARVFQQRATPDDIPEFDLTPEMLKELQGPVSVDKAAFAAGGYLVSVPLLLERSGLASSRGEARRLIAQGAVDIDDTRIDVPEWSIRPDSIIKVGKRRFLKVVAR